MKQEVEEICPHCHSVDNIAAHGKPCFYCNEPINNLAGNPGKWSLMYPQPDGTGVCRVYHVECVLKRLPEYQK